MKGNMNSNMGNKNMNLGGGGGGGIGGGVGGAIGGGVGGGMNMGNNSNVGNFGNASSVSNNPPSFGFPPLNDKPKSVLNGGVLQGYQSAREIRAKFPTANDCEIVVLEKTLV